MAILGAGFRVLGFMAILGQLAFHPNVMNM